MERQGKERDKTGSPCERLRYRLMQLWLVAAGQNVLPAFSPLVADNLNIAQKFWESLNLVEYRGRGMAAQKAASVVADV